VIARRKTFRQWWNKTIGKQDKDGAFIVVLVKVVTI
jgi:hypothetical protein